MTLQQLKYIVAVDSHRSFAKAAEACGVTQPTLSGMLQKLEDELDVRIFCRTNKSVTPTATGEKIILQARRAVAEAARIAEIVAEEKGLATGQLRLAIGQSIAPYLLPEFIKHYIADYPEVRLSVEEMKAETMAEALVRNIIDMGIAASGNRREGIFEIPLYTERFYVYLAGDCLRRHEIFSPADLEHENMWVMKEAQCLRDSAFSFCKARAKGRQVYEAGNVDTLIRIVDSNGGYTIIPEMHLSLLDDSRRKNVRPIDGDHLSQRRISLYVSEDFIRQGILDSVIATLRSFIPAGMLDRRITAGPIRL